MMLEFTPTFKNRSGDSVPKCLSIPHYTVAPEDANLCDKEGNPCNPSNGNKSQTEQDLDLPGIGLEFKRYYNSLVASNSSDNIGAKWRHSYSSHLDGYRSMSKAAPMGVYPQGQYHNPSGACVYGWNDIKATAYNGLLANATASYSNGLCQVTLNKKVVAQLRVAAGNTAAKGGFTQPPTRTLTRPDGTVYKFNKVNGLWAVIGAAPVKLEEFATGYQFTDANDTVEVYDLSGNLLRSTTRDGQVTTLDYANGSLAKVTGPYGHTLHFAYYTQAENEALAGLLKTVSGPTGTLSYEYDANKNLTAVRHPDGSLRRYVYENPSHSNHLTGIIDETGQRHATWEYDDKGRAIASYHGPQTSVLANRIQGVTFAYSGSGTTTVQTSRGATRVYNFAITNGAMNVTGISGDLCPDCSNGDMKNRSYDSAGNLTSYTDWSNTTTQFGPYDAKGQPAYKIEAVGTPQQRRLDYTYDPRFHHKVASITEASVASGRQKVTSYRYDDFGNRLSETVSGYRPDGTAVSRTTSYQYNGPMNQLSRIDGPRADVADITTFDYHPYSAFPASYDPNNGRLKRVTGPSGILRDDIQYTASGKIATERRPNGLRLDYAYYPGNDRLMTLTQTDTATGEARATRYSYLPSGEVETITQAHGTIDATTLTFGYDPARRLTRITDALGNRIEYTLDTEGNKTEEKTYDPYGALKKRLTQTFDLYNRLDIATQENQRDDYGYAPDGTLDTRKDGNGATTDHDYDALSRLVKTTQNAGGLNPATANTVTQYGYDSQDRLTRVTDPNGNATAYVYDDLGNLLSQTSPDTGATSYSYDPAGNLQTKQDANGNSFSYTHDAANRLTAIDAPGSAHDIAYTYDTCAQGRLCAISHNGSSVSYSYDAFGNITRHQGIDYRYDNAGSPHTITYPSGAIVSYTRDPAGQISQVQLTQGWLTQTLASNIGHAPFGPIDRLDYGNGRTLNHSRDSAYRLTAIDIPGVISLSAIAYDPNGNLIRRYLDTGIETYGYDPLDRLDTATGPAATRDYDHDKNGNRTRLIANGLATTYGHTPGGNRLASETGWTYTRDPNGNTTAKLAADGQGWQYSYTPHNRLVSATWRGQLKASYTYNGLGQRTSKTAASQTHYRYGQNGELLAELDPSGNVIKEYIHLDGQPLAVLQAGQIHYIHNDHLGTPQALSDAQGTKVWSASYDPYGQATVNEDPDGNGQRVTMNLRFPGQYHDQETGLHYNYFRDYDPGTGRYLESDPIGIEGGLNTYTYVENNPLGLVDPHGLAANPPICTGPDCIDPPYDPTPDGPKPSPQPSNTKPKKPSGPVCTKQPTFHACMSCCAKVSGQIGTTGTVGSGCTEACYRKEGLSMKEQNLCLASNP